MPSSSAKLRPMRQADIPEALRIIGETDEDDQEEAACSYEEGLEGHFCLVDKKQIVGVTGYQLENTRIAWLSWTYVDPSLTRQGYGTAMLEAVVDRIRKIGARKIFITTSDYRKSPTSSMLYGAAMRLYEKHQFVRELSHSDYFDKGENAIIYGRRLAPANNRPAPISKTPISIEGFQLIGETETSYYIEWEQAPSEHGNFSYELLQAETNACRKAGAQNIYFSLPSNQADFWMSDLSRAGYKIEGQLLDYHADGIHDTRFCNKII